MEKAKIRPLATPKHFNQSSPKLACVIRSWTAPGMQNFVAIGFRGFCSPKKWFFRASGVTFFVRFFFFLGGGFFNNPTAYTPERIFTQNRAEDIVLGKEVPFGGPDDCILYLDH